MRTLRAAVPAVVALALGALLHAGTLGALPGGVRVALAFAALVLLPGHGLLAAIGTRPPGGATLASGWALGLGVAWLGVLVLATRALHLPFTVLDPWAVALGALPWLAAALRAPAPEPAPADVLTPLAALAVLAAAALACWHLVQLPTPAAIVSDSPDHIGTIRRMMASGDAFPADAFFRDAGAAGADPRKGLWHPCVALVARLAGVDALGAWRALAALLAPLFVLNAAAFAFLVAGDGGAAVGAWALLLTYGGGLAQPFLREAVFATKLADQLALATATAVLVDLDARTARARLAVLGIGLGALAAHVFMALQFAIVFGALGVGLFVRERGIGGRTRRLLATAGALGLACLPYVLWRAHGAYAPRNVIHTQPQGLLFLAPGVTVVSPAVTWEWLGAAGLLVPLSWVAWARASARPAVLYLLTTSLAVALLLFCPPLVALLQPRLGYLLMRMVWLVPLSGAIAFALPALLRSALRGAAPARAAAGLGLAGVLLVLAPSLRAGVDAFAHPERARRVDDAGSVLQWRDDLAWMDQHLPQGTVVLSDPATSYSVPMLTRHWVATLVDQHSSPNDSLALTRILDARDALDPGEPWARTREVVRRWGVTAIALNDRFAETPPLDYWAPSHAWFVRARARFDAAPGAFRRVYDRGAFVVYTVDRAALDTLRGGGAARADERPYDAGHDGAGRVVAAGMPSLLAARLSTSVAHPGDTLSAALDWRAPAPEPPGYYLVSVRFEHATPAGFRPPPWIGKPARKLLERLRHERYRFRADHLPSHGDHGVDLWRPDEVVRDEFPIVVPVDVASGPFEVQVTLLRQPHYPNFHLSDYFFDHDYYSGLPVGTLTVTRAVGARATR